MVTTATTPLESLLLRILLPVCIISGIIVVSGFFFPGIIGEAVADEAWLVMALTFFGSGLGYIALLPFRPADETDEADVDVLSVRRRSVRRAVGDIIQSQDVAVVLVSIGLLGLFFAGVYALPASTLAVIGWIQTVVLNDLGWLFIGPMLLGVLTCAYLLVGPWGDVKLGGETAEPAYTLPVFFTLFFTAGIAAGIVFWGPAEALFHYESPPPLFDVEPASEAAIDSALMYALFHWGFSAWGAYLILGLPIAYFVYERGAPLRVSSILTPFLGEENLDHWVAKTVDVVAIFATIGGIATSVALVSQQFLSGIEFQFGVTTGSLGPIIFVAGLTIIFVISAQSGVHRGIRRIADLNIVLFGFFVVVFVALGPRGAILESGAVAAGGYLVNFPRMSVYFGDPWAASWTVWNWIWWFSWAPFAGLFLAALSRGRRIRTVVLVGFVATSLATMVWFIILGATSLHFQHSGAVDILGEMGTWDQPDAVAGFPMLDALPLGELLIFLFLALIIVFMTTSADTSTLVVAVLSAPPQIAPTTGSIVFWGLFQGIVAIGVILTGSEAALQAAAVLAGGPIAIIAIVALIGLVRALVARDDELNSVPRLVLTAVRDRRL